MARLGPPQSRRLSAFNRQEEGKAAAAKELVGTLNDVPLDSKEKEEILQLGAALHSLQSESEMLQQQLKRKVVRST